MYHVYVCITFYIKIMYRFKQFFSSITESSSLQELKNIILEIDFNKYDFSDLTPLVPEEPYSRTALLNGIVEVIVMKWHKSAECLPHDHGQSYGIVSVVRGNVEHGGQIKKLN